MKATALKFSPHATLRCSAEQRLRGAPHLKALPTVRSLKSAVEELHVYDAELQIQNEELLASRAQIEESQKKYFRHFDLAPVGLIRLNQAGLILEANMLGAQMLDVNRALLHSGPRLFLAHVAPESLTTFEQHLESARSSGRMEMCELWLRDARGNETFVRMQSVASQSETDRPDFYLTLTDLTEHREIERKLELQKVLAEAAVASKELFFAMLSHELRTPLTPLLALVEDLSSHKDRSADDIAAFAILRRNLDLETHLIDDLLDVTRITSGKLELRRETIDVHVCLQQAIGICQADIDAKGLQLGFAPGASEHFMNADAGRLQQVFWNLIKNAVKFTSTGGKIDIATRSDDASNLTIEIRDTGVGIDSWPLGHIFDPFFQVQLSLKQRGSGLGLGLAICKAITEAHGGTITAASAGLGKGATFRLELPTVVALPSSPPNASNPSRAARRSGIRLLLVEDHDDTRHVLAKLLQRRGYEIETARDAAEARSSCVEKTFDLLVTDLALPDATGYDLFRELNAEHELRGIALSGFGSDADIRQSMEAGFLKHLVKPIDATALDAAIQQLVSSP